MARERLEVKMKLIITRGSYETIQEESLNTETETGGLLIGTLEVPIVIRASKPGTHANKSWACYTNDSDYDNLILAETIKRWFKIRIQAILIDFYESIAMVDINQSLQPEPNGFLFHILNPNLL